MASFGEGEEVCLSRMGSSASISKFTRVEAAGLGGEQLPFAKQAMPVDLPVDPGSASSRLILCSPRAPSENSAEVEIPLDLRRNGSSGLTAPKDGINATVESRPASSAPSTDDGLERADGLGFAGPKMPVGDILDRADKLGDTVHAFLPIPDPLSSE